jgi:hypothetical protein
LIRALAGRPVLALLEPPGAPDVDQDAPHELGRDGEEVRAVVPVDPAGVDQPHVGFADEGRRLERVPRALAPHVVVGQAVQLVVHQGDQPVECGRVTPTPRLQQLRDSRRRLRTHGRPPGLT